MVEMPATVFDELAVVVEAEFRTELLELRQPIGHYGKASRSRGVDLVVHRQRVDC